jgi:ribosome-associated translation inhibitor RaiA
LTLHFPETSFYAGEHFMRIKINAPSDANRHHFQDSVIEQLTKTLARFSNRITTVNVTLADENGPRGIDKQCRVSIVMPRVGQLSASATHENPLAAVAEAADRARRVVLTKLKRPKSLQRRKRRSSLESFHPSSADDSDTIK